MAPLLVQPVLQNLHQAQHFHKLFSPTNIPKKYFFLHATTPTILKQTRPALLRLEPMPSQCLCPSFNCRLTKKAFLPGVSLHRAPPSKWRVNSLATQKTQSRRIQRRPPPPKSQNLSLSPTRFRATANQESISNHFAPHRIPAW